MATPAVVGVVEEPADPLAQLRTELHLAGVIDHRVIDLSAVLETVAVGVPLRRTGAQQQREEMVAVVAHQLALSLAWVAAGEVLYTGRARRRGHAAARSRQAAQGREPVPDAARRRGRSTATIYARVRDGTLHAVTDAGQLFVRIDDVNALTFRRHAAHGEMRYVPCAIAECDVELKRTASERARVPSRRTSARNTSTRRRHVESRAGHSRDESEGPTAPPPHE